ncbi:MAG: hypothetical protein K1060chlam1_00919 [Candidatus Anoxychlamydiales bacterium]|nr:hypothetical protein [Candidatus Anoxychlamydiales bacterium]
MKKKTAALIYGDNPNYIDHLSPLCHFLKIPLITNVEEIFCLIKKYYPKVAVKYIENKEINFYVVKNFDNILACTPKNMFDTEFRFHQDILNKEINIFWCPHGNSDKGKTVIFFEGLMHEKNVLIYGKKMKNILKEKKVFHTIENIFEIGNFRLDYFNKFKSHFKKIIKNEISKKLSKKLSNKNLNLLYAPTWEDKEKSSSFFKYIDVLLTKLPSKYNLIVKIHHNLIVQNETTIEIMKLKYSKKNILFLENFPLIYPLLDFIDIYIGDFSSIGYDFLSFNKAMFLLKPQNKKLSSDLFDIATVIDDKKIFETIENSKLSHHALNNENLIQKRKNLYDSTFKKTTDLEKLKNLLKT